MAENSFDSLNLFIGEAFEKNFKKNERLWIPKNKAGIERERVAACVELCRAAIARIEDPQLKHALEEAISELAFRALAFGVLGNFPCHRDRNSSLARKQLAKNRAPDTLIAIIKNVRGDAAAERPDKEANAIMGTVNARLAEKNMPPVKKDVISRCLKKFPPRS
jgi:hypothetical protein